MGICCMAQETQTCPLYQSRGVGWGEGWEGVSKGRGYMCTYGWFMLRFDRKQQNSVKQLSFYKKINWKKKNTQSKMGHWVAHNSILLHLISAVYILMLCCFKPVLWYVCTLATWWEKPTHWKRPWCQERLRSGEEGNRWDGWMASSTQWTWVWGNSGR